MFNGWFFVFVVSHFWVCGVLVIDMHHILGFGGSRTWRHSVSCSNCWQPRGKRIAVDKTKLAESRGRRRPAMASISLAVLLLQLLSGSCHIQPVQFLSAVAREEPWYWALALDNSSAAELRSHWEAEKDYPEAVRSGIETTLAGVWCQVGFQGSRLKSKALAVHVDELKPVPAMISQMARVVPETRDCEAPDLRHKGPRP